MLPFLLQAAAVTQPPHHHAFHSKKEPHALSPMTTELHQKATRIIKASMLSAMETKVYNCVPRRAPARDPSRGAWALGRCARRPLADVAPARRPPPSPSPSPAPTPRTFPSRPTFVADWETLASENQLSPLSPIIPAEFLLDPRGLRVAKQEKTTHSKCPSQMCEEWCHGEVKINRRCVRLMVAHGMGGSREWEGEAGGDARVEPVSLQPCAQPSDLRHARVARDLPRRRHCRLGREV